MKTKELRKALKVIQRQDKKITIMKKRVLWRKHLEHIKTCPTCAARHEMMQHGSGVKDLLITLLGDAPSPFDTQETPPDKPMVH